MRKDSLTSIFKIKITQSVNQNISFLFLFSVLGSQRTHVAYCQEKMVVLMGSPPIVVFLLPALSIYLSYAVYMMETRTL